MDKHYISDSHLFDIWCWREATPAILKRAIQQLANIGVNYTTIEADCWMGERTPELNLELQYTPFLVTDGKWDLTRPNPEWDARLKEFVRLCNENGIVVQLQLFTQQYDHWRDYMTWNGHLWPALDAHRDYVHRAVTACDGLAVRYSAGCELLGNPDEVARFHVDVLEIPFLSGVPLTSMLLGTDQGDGFVEPPNYALESGIIKGLFDKFWIDKYGLDGLGGKDSTAYFVRRYAHGVHRMNTNGMLDIGIKYHAPYGTWWEYSTDGDWGGDSEFDYIEHFGRTDRKPSRQQMHDLSAKLFDAFNRPIVIDVFHEGQYDGTTGRPVISRLLDLRAHGLLDNTMGVIDAYAERFGKPENAGRPVEPYAEPVEPKPPEPPTPVKPPFNLKGWWENNHEIAIAVIAATVILVGVLILRR